MVNQMATILGDVQYSQNGTVTNPYWLVVLTILKNMKVSWDDYSQYMEK